MAESTERERFLAGISRWTAILGAVAILLGAWIGDLQLSFTIALGALLGFTNLMLMGRGIARAMDQVAPEAEGQNPKPPIPAANVLQTAFRLPLLALALLLIVWYMPPRPEGLAIGFATVLVAAVAAAIEAKRG